MIIIQICYIKSKKLTNDESKIEYWLKYKSKEYLQRIYCSALICIYSCDLFAKTNTMQKMKIVEDKVNNSGDLIISMLQLSIYWITMFFALLDIIKTVKKQDISGVISIILKYGTMMVSAYAMPTVWNFIKELFID